ncbi:MAG: XRE family transcriptional regulator, partial [Candidatus Marsarchaeota archaeon]|nr:XRE family transcriptional regulator [Candidatus Marsarchaeota archaeon]
MSEEVAINSDVLKYVMSSSGYDASAFAKKIDVSKDDVENWLTGSKKPTLSKLKKISEATKYNLAVLLLEEAPKTLPKPKDYRSAGNSLSHKTLLAIRKARDIQALYNELGGSFEAHRISIDKYELSTDSEPVAEKERELLGIELKGSGETGAREVLKKCIKVLEQNGVLVLQRPMPIENCRGFSIKDKNPFIIAVSSKDDIYPRLFTLFHEYAHLILKAKDGALCIPEDDESNL